MAAKDPFAAAADTIFAANPRVVDRQRKQWQEEKGLSSIFERRQEDRRARALGSVSDEEAQDGQPLLRQVPSSEVSRDDFHRFRWRCVFQPERAVETLGPVAELQVAIIRAKDLACHELSPLLQPTCNAYCKVYLDDNLLCQSKCQQRTASPEWKFQETLGITCPYSMLRVQVVDQGNSNAITRHDLGFVEICLGDVPLNKDLEGWFELRHQDTLKRTSQERYLTHCERREDQVRGTRSKTVKVQEAKTEEAQDANGTDVNQSGQKSFLSNCVTYFSERSVEMGLNMSQAVDERANAGEILMRLRLSYLDRGRDSFFAKALNPPSSHDHGPQTLQAGADSDFELQHLWDEMSDVRQEVLEDAMSSTGNFMTYILHWRSIILSAVLMASLICPLGYSALFPHARNLYLWMAVLPAIFASVLLLLSWASLRAFMLQGGANAPLTQEGFVRVAAWRDTEQMMAFIARVATDLKGCIHDEHELRSFAARAFREGKPRLTVAELRLGLKAAKWVSFDVPASSLDLSEHDPNVLLREGFPSTQLHTGDLVLVDGRRRATVKQVEDPFVVVDYQGEPNDAAKDAAQDAKPKRRPRRPKVQSPSPEERIPKTRISMRPAVPRIPQRHVPRQLAGELYSLSIIIDDLKTRLCPHLRLWGDILCWRRWDISLLLLFLLVATSAASTLAFLLECCIDSVSGASLAKAMVRLMILATKILLLLALMGVSLCQAKWFVPLRALGRIAWRSAFHRRQAPKMWPFFVEAKAEPQDKR